MSTNKRLLVAVDASEASRRALDYVVEIIGSRPGFHVGLVHLELPPRMIEWGGSEDAAIEGKVSEERARTYREMEKEALAKGKALLQNMQEYLTERGIHVDNRMMQFDEPLNPREIARDVLEAARAHDYGTVVVGRHAFSWLKRLVQYHVGEELVRTGQGVTIWVVE